jgi:hypothetical protein
MSIKFRPTTIGHSAALGNSDHKQKLNSFILHTRLIISVEFKKFSAQFLET